jgi:hypothetical protein
MISQGLSIQSHCGFRVLLEVHNKISPTYLLADVEYMRENDFQDTSARAPIRGLVLNQESKCLASMYLLDYV